MRKRLGWLVWPLCAALLVLAGCSRESTTPAKQTDSGGQTTTTGTQAKDGGTLTLSASSDITHFDPYFSQAPLQPIYRQLFNTLVNYHGPDLTKPSPELAESWTESPDGKTLTMKVRKGVKFHNGREMTAQDIADNIDRAMDKSIGHTLYSRFTASVASAKATDSNTVEIQYKSAAPQKFNDLAELYIIPKEAFADIKTKPVGTGPFTFKEWVPGDHLIMVKNPNYWEKGKPHLDQVVVKVLPDELARMASLESGAIHLTNDVPTSQLDRLKKASGLKVVQVPPGATYRAIYLNMSNKPLDNVKVRQALNYSVDRQKFIDLAFDGQGQPTQTPYPEFSSVYDKKFANFYRFDLGKAKQLLTDAGYSNGFKITVITSSSMPWAKQMAQVWQQDLAKIGVTLDIQQVDVGQFFSGYYYPKKYDALISIQGFAAKDPGSLYPGASNLRPENSPTGVDLQPWISQYTDLISKGADSVDMTVRKPIYEQLQQVMAENGWTIVISYNLQSFALSNKVQGLVLDPDGNPWLADVTLAQ